MDVEWMLFVETRAFTQRVQRFGLEAALHELQWELTENPEKGTLDPGTGGLRKVRMPDPTRGQGKRGGARVHYLWVPTKRRIYLLFVYGKKEQATLSIAQKRQLQALVEQILVELAR